MRRRNGAPVLAMHNPLAPGLRSRESWGGLGGAGDCGNTTTDMEVVINQSYQDEEQVCNFELDMSLALCHDIQPYSRVNVSNVEVPLNFSCSDMDLLDWDNFEVTSP